MAGKQTPAEKTRSDELAPVNASWLENTAATRVLDDIMRQARAGRGQKDEDFVLK